MKHTYIYIVITVSFTFNTSFNDSPTLRMRIKIQYSDIHYVLDLIQYVIVLQAAARTSWGFGWQLGGFSLWKPGNPG